MRLILPSFFLWLYVTFSLLRSLPLHLPAKTAICLGLLAISLKYPLYEWLGGSFFSPKLPWSVLLVMEALYAALIILFILLVIRDIGGIVLWAIRHLGGTWHFPLSRAAQGACLAVTALILGVWGTWQSVRVPDVRTVEIVLPNLPKALDGFSIAQLSDIHIRTLLGRDWLKAVVDRTNALSPDMVALTGDFNDGLAHELEDSMRPLSELRARHGVYGVTGNHEYYFHADEWTNLLNELGVQMLHNEHRAVTVNGELLVVGGVPDPTEKRFGGQGPDLAETFRDAPDATRILLAHQPTGADAAAELADVQLSGHTHGGSLFFMKPLLAAFNDGFVSGLYKRGRLRLYVSPGTGIWGGFSCRLGVPSEITRLVLRAG